MKMIKRLALMVVASTFATAAMSATLITKEELKQHPEYVRVGVVSTSAELSPSEAKEALSKLADEKGGKYFLVTSGNTSNKISATAIVYKDK
ncbi:YdgH/BhsA/McbA-like domain containing protein [Pseudescherichia vulneris]